MKLACVHSGPKWIGSWLACALLALSPHAVSLAATNGKTLRLSTSTAETSYDNAFASDESSQTITERINEPMLAYHYLARPAKLVPRTLEALPTISDRGATFLCKVQKGIFFADDAAFKGAPRELTAADYAYSLKRLLDPQVKSPWLFLVEGKIVGGDEARAAATKTASLTTTRRSQGLRS